MDELRKCLRCGSTNLSEGEFQSTGRIYSRPKHAKFRTVFTTGVLVSSIICFDCGHVELTVDADKAKSLAKMP